MHQLIRFLLLTLLFAIPFFILHLLQRKRMARRQALAAKRLSQQQRTELARDFPLYAKLPNDLQAELEGLIHVFKAEKGFEACGGLDEVTDHMQNVIAAQACLLLLRRPHDMYAKLRTILVYPDAFTSTGPHGEQTVRLGESWTTGSVVLSWESVVNGARNPYDGHDVAIHEFAHQLDQEDGAGDGVPILHTTCSYREWSRIMHRAFEQHVKRVNKGKPTVIDEYGAESPAEFFAVATETFYEKPRQLHRKYPELYELLASYYGVSPLEWETS